MKLLIVLLLGISLLHLISGHDLNDCRLVCPTASLSGPPHAHAMRGKQGPKGEKGDPGLPGESGLLGRDVLDDGDLLSSVKKRTDTMERILYKQLSEEVARECGLGVQNKQIVADSQLSDGSHYYNREDHSAVHGRLFGSSAYGAWCGGQNSFQRTSGVIYEDLWIQVDFLKNVNATGVVTQGRLTTDQRATSYIVKYKKDGQTQFTTVEDENNQPIIFNAGIDRSTPKINKFDKTINARMFQIQVVSWVGYPSLRFDFINC